MATGWLKGIHCKSSVLDDIIYHPLPFDSAAAVAPRKKPPKPPSPSTSQSSSTSSSSASTSSSTNKKLPLLPLACGNSNGDVVPLFHRKSTARRASSLHGHHKHSRSNRQGKTKGAGAKGSSSSQQQQQRQLVVNNLKSPSPVFSVPSSFPTLTDLPRGHSSRQVVEIIFTSSWADHQTQSHHQQHPPTFPGEIEMLFRVHNPNSAVARFEACRAAVRARAGAADARCAADGNEMMRFRPAAAVPMPPAPAFSAPLSSSSSSQPAAAAAGKTVSPSVVFSASVCAGAGGVVRTFAGSGEAHESGTAGARGGRRAMLVCRVIAGRVRADDDEANNGSGRSAAVGVGVGEGEYEYDSVAVGNGELLVFDPGAVLPCFLIIYKL